ncbi:ribonuclease R family protein [Psittacicella gerlachiana]|uniref:exoribonuclease II n=1 Tax=Psittacicella gerlachiana TaxID=2028574 RepID=A0A3A1YE03_9GAMM|nr:VacB/RNase II family 3'-5' exoribonuclease [Psittacicella gerlachiana]RIY35368.1 hypothetical protein CKF59_03700 [Psittacicella gerlachiana]
MVTSQLSTKNVKQFFKTKVFRSLESLYKELSTNFSEFSNFSYEEVISSLRNLNWLYAGAFGYYVYPTKKPLTLYRISVTNSGVAFASELTEAEANSDFFKKEKKETDIFIPRNIVDANHFLDGDIFYSNLNKNNADSSANVFIFKKLANDRRVCDVRRNTNKFVNKLFVAYVPNGDHIDLINLTATQRAIEEFKGKEGYLGIIRQVRNFAFAERGGFVVINHEYVLERIFNSDSEVENTIESVLSKFELPVAFADDVVAEAQSFGEEVPEYDLNVRKDLTHLNFVTIDGEDARDFDDAVYCEQLTDKSGWRLYVAIADVSYYVRENTPLGESAAQRSTSIYFPTRVVPMLPEELSNGLCSINPQVKRFTLVCEMIIDNKGKLKTYDFYQACIISKNRFTYNQVQEIINSDFTNLTNSTAELNQDLRSLYKLYQKLTLAREERGAIALETSEPHFRFNPDGSIAEMYFVQRHDAHKMIEELMVITNVAAAKFVYDHGVAAPNRNHSIPTVERITTLNNYLANFNLAVPPFPQPKDYQNLAKVIDTLPSEKELVYTQMLRSLPRAVYETDSHGHFGLALDKYAQFTSPIRRYPDLLLHRVIKAIIFAKVPQIGYSQGAFLYQDERMDALCETCSNTEFKVEKACYDFLDWIKCRFMQRYIGKEFVAIVSTITKNGLFLTIPEFQIDGFLSFSGEDKALLEKVKNNTELRDKLKIRVHKISLHDRRIEFVLNTQKVSAKSAPKERYVTQLGRTDHSESKPKTFNKKKSYKKPRKRKQK